MKRFFLAIVFTFMELLSFSQNDSLKPIITTTTIGSFVITTHDSLEVIVKVDKVKYPAGLKYDYPDADVSISILNSKNKVLFIRNLPSSNWALDKVESINLTGIGKALILVYDQFPCVGKGCSRFQILGFNEIGYFVPFTGLIDLDLPSNTPNTSNFKIKWLNSSGQEMTNNNFKVHQEGYQPYLEIKDYRFFCDIKTLNYYPVVYSGQFTENGYTEVIFEKIPILYHDSNYQTVENVDDERFKVPINLYTKPDTLSTKKVIKLKANSIIKYIEGYYNSNFWIHLRINGYDGFILWNDLYYLGLNSCDM